MNRVYHDPIYLDGMLVQAGYYEEILITWIPYHSPKGFFYVCTSLVDVPSRVTYRILGEACPWWNNRMLVQTRSPIEGLIEAPEFYDNGIRVDEVDTCIIEWASIP